MVIGGRHNEIIEAVITKALRIKLDLLESTSSIYTLTEENYRDLQRMILLLKEMEELDILSNSNGTIEK